MKILLSPEEISAIVARLAGELRAAYGFEGAQVARSSRKPPVMIGILNGAFIFAADLVRSAGMPLELDFMRLSSYGMRRSPTSEVCITKDIEVDIKGRDVLIVEDIVDRGLTLETIMGHLKAKGPASVKVCALLLRSKSEKASLVDFVGHSIDEGFVVGYGLDYKERYRELPALYVMEAEDSGEGL